MDKRQSIWIQIRTFNGPMYLCINRIYSIFQSRSTSVYVAFLDAGKAFEKNSHWTLFKELIDRHVPLYLVVILCYWYQHQEMTVSRVTVFLTVSM